MKKIIFIFIQLFTFIIASSLYFNIKTDTITVTINDKESIPTEDGHKYLIYTDKGVFENTDDLLHFKFNSSDLYNKLKVNHKYTILVNGIRIPFLSMYKNIIDVK